MTMPSRHRRRYPTLTPKAYRELFRAKELPPQPWKYTITPRLVRTRVADAAGQMRASPLSYCRQKEFAARANFYIAFVSDSALREREILSGREIDRREGPRGSS